jgi:hypothetical protein
MKRTFTSSFLGLAISGLLLASCSQMASYENEDLALEQARADKAGFTLSPYRSTDGNENAFLDYYEGACTSECIDPLDPETFFVLSDREQFNPQIYIDYEIYHDATTIYYSFTIGTYNSSEPLISKVNGVDVNGLTYSIDFPLEEGWQGCDLVERTFTVTRGGGGGGSTVVEIPTLYSLIPICTGEEETCDEAFSYERDEIDPNIITFKYTPSTTIENAQIQLTVPQIEDYEAMDGKTYTGFGEDLENVLRWNGDLTCGEEITFTIKFTPISCTAAGPGNGLVNLVSTFIVKGYGNKLTGKPITSDCIPD